MKISPFLIATLFLVSVVALVAPASASNIPYFTDPSFESGWAAWSGETIKYLAGDPAYEDGNGAFDVGEHRTGSQSYLFYPFSTGGVISNNDIYSVLYDGTGDGIDVSHWNDIGIWYKISLYDAAIANLNPELIIRVRNETVAGHGWSIVSVPITGNVGAWTFINGTIPAEARAISGNSTVIIGLRVNKTNDPEIVWPTNPFCYLYIDDLTLLHLESDPVPATADFTANVTIGGSPLHVNLYSTSTGDISAMAWHVTQPDLTTLSSGGEQFNITLTQAGSYDVQLIVEGTDGDYSFADKYDYLTVTESTYDLSLNVTGADVGEPVGATLIYSDISTVERIEYSAPISSITPTWQKFKKITGTWFKWSDVNGSYSVVSSLSEATHPAFVFTTPTEDVYPPEIYGENARSYVRVQIYSSSASLYMEQVNILIEDSEYYFPVDLFVYDSRYSAVYVSGVNIEIKDYTAGLVTTTTLPDGHGTTLLINGHQYNITAYKTGWVNQSILYAGIGPGTGSIIFALSPSAAAGDITVRFQVTDDNGVYIPAPGVGIVNEMTGAENTTYGTNYGIAGFTARAGVDYTYYVWKGGYFGVSGEFNSDTDIIIPIHLSTSAPVTTTVPVTPIPTPTVHPTIGGNYSIVDGIADQWSEATGIPTLAVKILMGCVLIIFFGFCGILAGAGLPGGGAAALPLGLFGGAVGLIAAIGLDLIPWVLIVILIICILAAFIFFRPHNNGG